jgi:hypothetical protein
VLQGTKKPIVKPAKKGVIKKPAVKKKEEYASF